jgi:holo-[acyl-carrier protein] synthase
MEIAGIGTDIVECLRVGRMIEEHGELFLVRVYTEREILYCRSRQRDTEQFAAHWAAKEAILKCLGLPWRRGLSWTDIEVRMEAGNRPKVMLCGAAKDIAQSYCRARIVSRFLVPKLCLGTRKEQEQMFDDRICPVCQVLLRDWSRTCVKCGRTVEPEKTNLSFIDLPSKVHPWFAHHLGPFWGGLATAAVFLLLILFFVGGKLLKTMLNG